MKRTGSFPRAALLSLLVAAVLPLCAKDAQGEAGVLPQGAAPAAEAGAPADGFTDSQENGSPASVSAEISAQKIGLDDTLIYTLTFQNIDNPTQPDLSYLDDFQVLQTARSSEFQLRDGASRTTTRFTYYLMPTRSGRLDLPAVRYRHQGREHQTRAFAIEVVKGSLARRSPPAGGSGAPFADDFFSSPFAPGKPQQIDAFLRAAVSKSECLPGEQVLFRVRLFTRSRIEAVNMLSSASFAGFWQEWFPTPQSIVPESENVDGVVYQVYEIRKAALFASESGTLTIPALEFELQAADPGSPFLAARALRRSSQQVKVRVLEPPAAAAGLPVGRFTFSLAAPRLEADVNEIVTLSLRISGSGNTKAIVPPLPPASELALVYPPKVSRETDFAGAALTGTLRAEIPVAFKRRGEVVFAPLEFRYYDPQQKAVVSLRSDPVRLRVSGEKQSPALVRTAAGSAVVQQGEDIDFIKGGRAPSPAPPLHRRRWYVPLLAALFAANLLVLLKVAAWDRLIAPSAGMRRRRILTQALKGLAAARRPGDLAPVMEAFFCATCGCGRSQVDDRRIAETLAVGGVAKAAIDRFLFLKGQSDLARFAPGGKSALELQRDRRELGRLFREIDRKLK